MKWGNWVFDSDNLTLTYEDDYEIDFEKIHSSAAILDWIFQIQGKNWGDAQTVYDLLEAFHDILNPQANYCSFEKDTMADGGELARAYAAKLRRS